MVDLIAAAESAVPLLAALAGQHEFLRVVKDAHTFWEIAGPLLINPQHQAQTIAAMERDGRMAKLAEAGFDFAAALQPVLEDPAEVTRLLALIQAFRGKPT